MKNMCALKMISISLALFVSGAASAQTALHKPLRAFGLAEKAMPIEGGVGDAGHKARSNPSWVFGLAEKAIDIEIVAADLAVAKATDSPAIISFAEQIKRDQLSNKQMLSNLRRFGFKPENDELINSLSFDCNEPSKGLADESEASFGNAFLQCELAFTVFMTGVLEVNALQSLDDPNLRPFIRELVATFERHKSTAEALLAGSPRKHHRTGPHAGPDFKK